MQDTYYGLILGKNECKLTKEYAAVAIDVDLSHYDIRPIHCPKEICTVQGECLTHVSEDCCKTDYWSVCDPKGVIAVQGGELTFGPDDCSPHEELCVPKSNFALGMEQSNCECGDTQVALRYATITADGREGPLSDIHTTGVYPPLAFPPNVVVYASQGNGWFCQGSGSDIDLENIQLGPPPVSEGWCECPSNVKFLERHSSGSLMTISGNMLHISHPCEPHLWGKYDLCHCRELLGIMGINGTIFAFDGQSAYTVDLGNNGYILNEFDDNVCIKSMKQLTVYNGAIFLMTNDGPRSISGSQYNRSIFGYLNSNFINPTYFCGDNDWAIGVFGGKVHFSNGENAYIYDLLTEQPYALTESSLVPKSYHTNCDGIYYHMEDGTVMQWNPCDTEYCPYTYCTSTDKADECKNWGVMEIHGSEFGDIRTQVTVSYVDKCCNCTEICEIPVKFCKTLNITGCSNTHGVKTCYTGTDIIFMHNYATSPSEIN